MYMFQVQPGKVRVVWGLLALMLSFAPANTNDQAMASAVSQSVVQGMAIPVSATKLLQFTASGHVLGFGEQGVYVAAGDHVLKTGFVGARRVSPQARGGSQGASSGAQPMQRVTYKDLWDSVTLVYERESGGIVKSTWRIAPHAQGSDPVRRIRLAYNATAATDVNGNLVLGLAGGNMVESAPIAWQEIRGEKVPVDVSFSILAEKEAGFLVSTYDPAWPLVIDPALTWNTFMGAGANQGVGSGIDKGEAIAVDAVGNIYITGQSSDSWGTPIRPFSVNPFSPMTNAFVAKLNNNGVLQWNTFLGSVSADQGFGIAVDAAGNIFVIGRSAATWGAPLRPFSGSFPDAFVARLSNIGVLQWNTFLGGGAIDEGDAIAVDTAGNVVITGFSLSTWGAPVIPFNFGGSGIDSFVASLSSNGTLQWNTFMGSSTTDTGAGIAVDAAGNVFVTGRSASSWGAPLRPFTFGVSPVDAFVAKLNNTGILQWNTFLGGGNIDQGNAIAVDAVGNVYVTGESRAAWGAPVMAFGGSANAFVARLSNIGVLQWNTFLGGNGLDHGNDIAVDAVGNIDVTGFSNFPWGAPIRPFSGATAGDAFVSRLSNIGVLQWNMFLGGGGNDIGNGIAVDATGNIYVAGNSDATWAAPVKVFSGGTDALIARIPAAPTVAADLAVTKTAAPNPVQVGNNLTYTVIVTNNGPADPATGVTLTDTLPANTTFVSATPTIGACNVVGVSVTCNLGNVTMATPVTVTLMVTPTQAGQITNTAAVAGNEADPTPGNNSAQAMTTVTVVNSSTIVLSLNGTAFNSTTSNTLILTATTLASIPPTIADVYVALQLPNGTLLVMQPGGSFSTALTPLLANVSVPNFNGPIFNFTFTGAAPVGAYAWFAALMQPGTLNVIGTLATAPFTFAP